MAYYIQSKDRWGVSYREPGTGRKRLRTFKTKREAELFQAELRVDPERKRPETQGHRALADAAREYYQQGSHQAVTKRMDKYKFLPVLEAIGHVPVHQINEGHIRQIVDMGRARGNKNCTINRTLDILRAVLRYAKCNLEVPRLKDDRAVMRPPTQEEVRRILAVAQPHVYRVIVLACSTGMRVGPSELLKVTWGDVDFDRLEIFLESAKKGGIRQRYIPISAALLPKLLAWFHEDGQDLSTTIIHYKGRPVGHIKRGWAAALRDAGISRRLRPYDCRHHFATYALGAGADLKSVSDILGHSSAQMTLNTYQHVLERGKRQAVDTIKWEE